MAEIYQNKGGIWTKVAESDRLPLTGGTMTGSIEMEAAADKAVIVKQSANTSKIGLVGGVDWKNGAGLDLYGKDYSDAEAKGQFDIFANDGVNTVKKLTGKPNGALTWGGKRVPTVVGTYVNGTSDVNGNFDLRSYRPAGTSVPIGFLSVNMTTETARVAFMCGGYYMSFSNSGTSWMAWANEHIEGTVFWMVL